MTEELFDQNAEWDICLGAQLEPNQPYIGSLGWARVDGKDIPCTSLRVDVVANGVTTVTLTFIPRKLRLSVEDYSEEAAQDAEDGGTVVPLGRRQPEISEMALGSCKDCPFYAQRCGCCEVPGGACVFRAITGIPGYCVGDILQKAGVISDEWAKEFRSD